MTGWRLGWMVAPSRLVPTLNRLTQNFFINAPTLSQLAAASEAFDCVEELDAHVDKYHKNRDILLKVRSGGLGLRGGLRFVGVLASYCPYRRSLAESLHGGAQHCSGTNSYLARERGLDDVSPSPVWQGLADLGFTKVAPADGAFYIYVDVGEQVEDSEVFCRDLLEDGFVAVTPGTDFEDPKSGLGKKRVRFSYCGATADMVEAVQRMKKFWKTYPKKLVSLEPEAS
jgi:aspartate/methionine/tyrosine aminotransferase